LNNARHPKRWRFRRFAFSIIPHRFEEPPLKPSWIKTTLCAALALFLQTANAGTVNITVLDAEGKPAPDVVILVRSTQGASATAAAKPVLIEQSGLRFAPFLSVVPVGSTVRFANRDAYDHHIRSMPSGPLGGTPPVQEFELRLDAATAAGSGDGYSTPPPKRKAGGSTTADLKVTQTGAITLGCHLHSSMRGHLYVADTPWFGKTDASGKVSIDNVPDAAAEVVVWHPDQLAAQAPLKLQVAAGANAGNATLNFTPRKRRGG
jgi:plastocyanin